MYLRQQLRHHDVVEDGVGAAKAGIVGDCCEPKCLVQHSMPEVQIDRSEVAMKSPEVVYEVISLWVWVIELPLVVLQQPHDVTAYFLAGSPEGRRATQVAI